MPASIQLHRVAIASPPSPSTSPPSISTISSISSQSHHQITKSSIPIWICAVPSDSIPSLPPNLLHRHMHFVSSNQCCSSVIRSINASLETVWSVVRRFDSPQTYKHFLKSCDVIIGNGDVGTLREVRVVSGLPAELSRERLEILDDEEHVMSFSVVGGDHRLENYRSVTTVHREAGRRTVVVESYVVDTPVGNTAEETTAFVDTIVKCNLQSLASIAEGICRSLD